MMESIIINIFLQCSLILINKINKTTVISYFSELLYKDVIRSYRTSEYFSKTIIQNDLIFWIVIKNYEMHNILKNYGKILNFGRVMTNKIRKKLTSTTVSYESAIWKYR